MRIKFKINCSKIQEATISETVNLNNEIEVDIDEKYLLPKNESKLKKILQKKVDKTMKFDSNFNFHNVIDCDEYWNFFEYEVLKNNVKIIPFTEKDIILPFLEKDLSFPTIFKIEKLKENKI